MPLDLDGHDMLMFFIKERIFDFYQKFFSETNNTWTCRKNKTFAKALWKQNKNVKTGRDYSVIKAVRSFVVY